MPTTAWKAEKKGATPKRKHTNKATSPEVPTAETSKKEPDRIGWISVSTVSLPQTSLWLRVTSLKTGYDVFVPLPIRMIQALPPKDGAPGGCIVRGAHGDEATAKEGVLEILGRLTGAPLGGASEWQLAG